MKIFLARIYLLVPFVIIKYKYYKNENISGVDLLLVPFAMIKYKYYRNENISVADLLLVPFVVIVKNTKKCFDIVYIYI